MATIGQVSARQGDALHRALPRLYKFAIVLTVNEELARPLLRGTCRTFTARTEGQEADRERFTKAFRHMYSLWNAKFEEDPNLHRRYPADPALFGTTLLKGSLAGNAHFPRFIANLPPLQRAVLYLVYGEGFSYDEAAEIIGQPLQPLMNILARGHLAVSHWLDHRTLSEAGVLSDGTWGGILPGSNDDSTSRVRAA